MGAVGFGVDVYCGGVEATADVAGDLGGLGGVLGQVAGGHAVGDLAVGAGVDDALVELVIPGDGPAARPGRVGRCGEAGEPGGPLDGGVQVIDGELIR